MGLPNIIINFKSTAATAIQRGERGIVCVLLVDSELDATTITKIESVTEIDSLTLTTDEKNYLKRGWIGGINPIKYMQLILADTLAHGLNAAQTIKFDYLVGAPDIIAADATDIATAIKTMRSNGIKVKAVLPNTASDDEGIINFTTDDIVCGTNTYSTEEFCSRIAGLLAGTPLQQSATFYTLSDVDDVPKKTKAQLDAAINAGKFEIFNDGEKVKVARAVNSLTTIGTGKSADWKSIKIIDIMDLIYMDIKRTCEDYYIGRYPNNYDNKCILITAIQAYLEGLRQEELLDTYIHTEIDLESQTTYLRGIGVDVDDMTEQEIKEANTSTYVWILATYHILNAIEDITVNFYI